MEVCVFPSLLDGIKQSMFRTDMAEQQFVWCQPEMLIQNGYSNSKKETPGLMCCWRGLFHCPVQWTELYFTYLIVWKQFHLGWRLNWLKYKLNMSAEMERQLCISVQCLCASSKENLAAITCAFYLVKYATPKEEHCKFWYVKVNKTERQSTCSILKA